MFSKRIYLDYASLTPMDPRVIRIVKKYSSMKYANPSSLYLEGVLAKKALMEARRTSATFIGAHPDEIVFVSGGTEANQMALDGVARAARMSGIQRPHFIISAIEHSSIIESASMLEKYGCDVTRLPVDVKGLVSLDELKKSIKKNTVLVSVMSVNNEVGTVEPIREIAKIIRQMKKQLKDTQGRPAQYPLFHTDASQAALNQDLNVEKLGVDMLTLDGSKVYGPRGVGCLYIRRNTPIQPIIHGGGQESGMRSGTENIPAIMGFAKALEITKKEHLIRGNYSIDDMRAEFIEGLKKIRSDITVNGVNIAKSVRSAGETKHSPGVQGQSDKKVVTLKNEQNSQSPHILNVSIPGIDNEFFVLQLDARGVACSTKSSCLRDQDDSYVLKAMGIDSKSSVRFSFGRWTRKGDVKKTLKVIRKILIK